MAGRKALVLGVSLASIAFLLSFSNDFRSLLHTTGRFHPWYHLALFAILGVLSMRSSSSASNRLLLLAAAVLVGMGIEYVEAARFQATIEWNDVRTDTAGVLLGAVAGWLLARRAHRVP